MPDRIEAGTFALSVLGCSGKLILSGVNTEIYKHLKNILRPISLLKLKKLIIKVLVLKSKK